MPDDHLRVVLIPLSLVRSSCFISSAGVLFSSSIILFHMMALCLVSILSSEPESVVSLFPFLSLFLAVFSLVTIIDKVQWKGLSLGMYATEKEFIV